MGLFDRMSDRDKQARRELRADQRRRSLDESRRLREEQDRWELDRRRRQDEEAERMRQLDMRDGRYDGRV